jgi:CubicO group peptidase (beta-lactamase class C family)
MVAQGDIDLDNTVGYYLSEISSGYVDASLRDVLNMNVINDYSEDYEYPSSTVFSHEEAMGWRLPKAGAAKITNRDFLRNIKSDGTTNHDPEIHYNSANTDVLVWVAEKLTGRPLRKHLIDIVEAAGLEGMYFTSTDRDGMPIIDGGASMTRLDLARYGQRFVRGGTGVSVAFCSVLEDESGYDQQYIGDVIRMCQEISLLSFG